MNTDTRALAEQLAKPSDAEQQVLDVLIALQRNGQELLCAWELQETMQRVHSKDVPLGWITGRLAELKDKGVVEVAEQKRRNPVTQRPCQQWYIPAQQARLCA
jgi:hypothetical protein